MRFGRAHDPFEVFIVEKVTQLTLFLVFFIVNVTVYVRYKEMIECFKIYSDHILSDSDIYFFVQYLACSSEQLSIYKL